MAQKKDAVLDDLLSDVIPANILHKQPPPKVFKPWHRPRKQWVRVKQWKREIQNLVDAIQLDDPKMLANRPLTYLSLPGDDLLDVRVVYEACEHKQVRLKFLGFNDTLNANPGIDTEQSISIAEVVSLPLVDDNSLIVPDRIESIANIKSIGYDRIRNHGTFDVINIDLCNSISTPRQRHGNNPTYYDALSSLLAHQVNTRTAPWLFFLTTKCGRDDVDPKDVSRLYGCIKSNVVNSGKFRATMMELFGMDNFDENDLTLVQEQMMFPAFMQMFCIGFGKWLLQRMLTGISPSKVKMLKSYYYQVQEPGDMISVAYRFDPAPELSVDPAGLTSSSAESVRATETQLAVTIVERTKNLVDVDGVLTANSNEMEQMIISTESLLRSARYPTDEYRSWLYSGEGV